jgi:hypothetical protein
VCPYRAPLATESGGGRGGRGGCEAGAFQGPEALSGLGAQGQVARAVRLDRQSGNAGGAALTVRLVGERLADAGSVGGRGGIVPMREEVSAWAPQVGAAPAPGPGGAHVSGVHIGLRAQPPAEQGGNVGRIARIVCGLAARDGVPVEGVTEDKGHPRFRPPVGQPGPRESSIRPPPRGPHERAPWPGGTVLARLASGGAAAFPPPGSRGRRPWSGHARRAHHTRSGGWCRSAGGLLLLRAWRFPAPVVPRRSAEGEASISINPLQRTGGQRCFSAQ